MVTLTILIAIIAGIALIAAARRESALKKELTETLKQVDASKDLASRAEAARDHALAEVKDLSSILETLKKEKQFVEQDLQRTQRRLNELIEAKDKFGKADVALQDVLHTYVDELSERIVSEATYANLESSRRRISKTFTYCRKFIPDFAKDRESHWYEELKRAWEDAVRKEEARQEQVRIKEQMRDELRAKLEYDEKII